MDTIKIIEAQQSFAKNTYLDFMSKRFGITPCCIKDAESAMIKKYLCDWESNKKDIPQITSVSTEIFKPTNPQSPCLDTNAPEWCSDCSNQPENANVLETSIAVLIRQLKNLQGDLQIVLDNITLKELEISSKEAEIAAKGDLLTDAKEDYDSTCLVVIPPQPYCSDLFTVISQLESDINNLQNELVILQTELFVLEKERDSLLIQIEDKEEEIIDIQKQFCVDDAECITVSVVDTNGNAVENFELYIDGGNAGFTDNKGEYKFTVYNASVNTDHTLQICYCFTTEGACRQQKITITVKADPCAEECKPLKACSQIEIEEIIIGEN